MKHIFLAFGLVVTVAVSGCVTTPVLEKGETAQIVGVTVTAEKGVGGTLNLPEAVRYKTQNAAYRFAETGSEKMLNLHLVNVQITSPGAALWVGGSSVLGAKASLVNKATGQEEKQFETVAVIPRLGGVIGAISSANVDPVQEEQRLAGMLAEDAMMRIYGKEYAETVAERTPLKQDTPTYPISYDDARKQIKCEQISAQNELEREDARDKDDAPENIEELPAYCTGFLKVSQN